MSEQTTLAEAIASRIRALLAKTVDNGCTEAEALAAAAKARDLMDRYRLTQSDVQIEAEPIDDVLIERPSAQKLAAVDHTLHGIDAYCGVKTWFSNSRQTGKRCVRMIGLHSDVEMATYLYRMLATTIASEARRYMAEHRSGYAPESRRVSQSFQVGMAVRINTRLKEMAAAANATATTSTGTALVVVKDHAVSAAWDALGIKLGRGLAGPQARSQDAFDAGRVAGDRVNLSRPVGGAGQGRLAG